MARRLENIFQDFTLSSRSIDPGFFQLSINILFQPDTETLNERKKLLELNLQDEHSTTHVAINNLIALINHRLPRRQNEVRKILEDIKESYPNHLNTLANLEVVYKELHRQKNAEECRHLIDKIVQSKDPKDIKLQAQCILEQGYALMVEETSNHEGAANQKMRDSLKILISEHDKSVGDRRHHLNRALRYTQQACSSVMSAMQCKKPDAHIQRKKDSIERFMMGMKLLESINEEKSLEYKIWKFYLGMALNRFDYSVYLQEDSSEKDDIRITLCAHALQCFWDTIKKLQDHRDSRMYIGRSYAYMGHLIISHPNLLNKLEHVEDCTCLKNTEFKRLTESPKICFDRAMRLRSSDTVVLNRYGRSLRNMSLQLPNTSDEKRNALCQAYELLSKSIQILPHSNWFAYITKMQICRDLALLDDDNTQEWLEEARMDGIHCFKSKATETDLCILAKICQMLAKFPYRGKYGPKFVKRKDYIHEAIHYLNYALQLGGFNNYNALYTLGTCLYEIEEYRTALEWMKRAMYISKKSGNTNCLTRIGEYILAFHKSKYTEHETQRGYLFDELRFVMGLGKSKYSDIEMSIKSLCKYQHKSMIDFSRYLITASKLNDEFSRELIKSCLKNLEDTNIDPSKKTEFKNLRSQFELLPSLTQHTVIDLPSDTLHTPPEFMMPFSEDAIERHSGYEYDFFISHSNVNKDWVHGYLLHQLETKLHDDDVAFKGCIADRDFIPGDTIISNIINAVDNSHTILLIITPAFIESRWCDFEVDQALIDKLKRKKENKCVVPVLLEEVNENVFPAKLSAITHLDLTDETKHDQELVKLKRALLPDMAFDLADMGQSL